MHQFTIIILNSYNLLTIYAKVTDGEKITQKLFKMLKKEACAYAIATKSEAENTPKISK